MSGGEVEVSRRVVIDEQNRRLRADWAYKYHWGTVMPDLRTPAMALYWTQVMIPRRERMKAWLQSLPHRHAARDFWVDRAFLRLAKAKAAKANKVFQFRKAAQSCAVLPFRLTK